MFLPENGGISLLVYVMCMYDVPLCDVPPVSKSRTLCDSRPNGDTMFHTRADMFDMSPWNVYNNKIKFISIEMRFEVTVKYLNTYTSREVVQNGESSTGEKGDSLSSTHLK